MPLLYILLMGLVQGLTEFIPVSSTAHLSVMAALFDQPPSLFFDMLLHIATLIAVVVFYWSDVRRILRELLRIIPDYLERRPSADPEARRLIGLLIISVLPLFAILPFTGKIEDALSLMWVIGIALLGTSVILFLADRVQTRQKDIGRTRWYDALIIGAAQAVAVIPGLSRSGTTIAASLFRGLDRETAVRYSFLLSLPTILGSALVAGYKAVKDDAFTMDTKTLLYSAAGMILAGIVGYLAIGIVRALVKKGRFTVFSIYCALLGIALIIWGVVK